MAEETNSNEQKEEVKKETSINDLVEEVERLLQEVEDKELLEKIQNEDVAEEIKDIIEKPNKKREVAKKEKVKKEKFDSKDLITIKGETKEITITKEQLEKIEEEIKNQKDISKQDLEKIHKAIFKNLIIAILLVGYFIALNLGCLKLKGETYLNDLRVFTGILVAITVFMFEKAYRKESKDFAIMGIETFFVALVTLFASLIYIENYPKFVIIVNIFALLFAIYYVGKSIIIYLKMKKAALKKISDVRNIISRSK